MPAIQDHYPAKFAHCYGCGVNNPQGHKLKSYLKGNIVEACFTVDPVYSGGVPLNAYGGLLASLLDCHGAASAAAFAYRDAGRTMGDDGSPIRFVTGTLNVVFHKPTPLNVELQLQGRLESLSERKAVIALALSANGEVHVSGEMVAIRYIDPTLPS
ncbi:PaaI family thioesterase [Pseudomonas putida]|uniref:PaaI family thioesterase n=1 Tax=Pseudomonas putida TaxID=303 RepID=UPI0033604EAE